MEDVTPDPVDVGLLGADGVMLHPQMPADAVEELGAGGGERGGCHSEAGVMASKARRRMQAQKCGAEDAAARGATG
jgi:hypothetical protein